MVATVFQRVDFWNWLLEKHSRNVASSGNNFQMVRDEHEINF